MHCGLVVVIINDMIQVFGEMSINNIIVKKLNSLKHLVRTTVAELHNENSKYEKGAIT